MGLSWETLHGDKHNDQYEATSLIYNIINTVYEGAFEALEQIENAEEWFEELESKEKLN